MPYIGNPSQKEMWGLEHFPKVVCDLAAHCCLTITTESSIVETSFRTLELDSQNRKNSRLLKFKIQAWSVSLSALTKHFVVKSRNENNNMYDF